ncbi:MAG TPA: hypothetical protein VK020_12855 [Microlunatus sp.]|nr:hypothetical protein [Microlunatus sp.]
MPPSRAAGRSGLLDRLPALCGTAVLVLTATPWMQRTLDAEPGDLQQTYSLWGLLATVNHGLMFLLILAIVALLAFVVVVVLLRPDRMVARAIVSWLAVAASGGILLNIDAGYGPGAGGVLTLVLCLVTALATSSATVFRGFVGRPDRRVT